jgi:hypothetical protein
MNFASELTSINRAPIRRVILRAGISARLRFTLAMSPNQVAIMERLFLAEEWQQPAAGARARRCWLLAFEAEKLAESADPGLKEANHALATQWTMLAEEIEQARGESSNLQSSSSPGLRIG